MRLDRVSARTESARTAVAELEESIKVLKGEVAKMDAAQAEASKIRNDEHEDYVNASSDFKASGTGGLPAFPV